MRHMTTPRLRWGLGFALAPIFACLLLNPHGALGSELVLFGGGSMARIHDAESLMEEFITFEGESVWLRLPGSVPEELLLPPAGNEGFHPHSPDPVRDLLRVHTYPGEIGEVEIFLLPFPRTRLMSSSTIGNRIFLSPGSAPPSSRTTHMLLAHELGHVFHNHHMGGEDSGAWRLYRRLRRLTDTSVYNSEAEHCSRPREILAEDFRFLFGGALANYSGSIENGTLPLPDAVQGLREFFLSPPGIASLEPGVPFESANFPNPFNPDTRIFLSAGDALRGESLRVRVLDGSGRLCRRLYDGKLTGRRMEFEWDGRDGRGTLLGSGVYFAELRLGERRLAHKMILVK